MKSDKLLSIIVPVYNGEKYLAETLKSISNTSYNNIEVIIVDDGSIDNSEEIYQKARECDKRFRIIKQGNQGIAGARNTGLKEAKGDYIVFCDQDDLVGEFFYEYAIKKMEEERSDMCICSTAKFYENKSVPFEQHKDYLYEGEEILNKLLICSLFDYFKLDSESQIRGRRTIWNCVMKTSLLLQNHLVFKRNVSYEDDMIMRVEAIIASGRISTLEYCGYFWRTNLSSESHKVKYITDMADKQKLTREYIKNQLIKCNYKEFAVHYENYQKVLDSINFLENERYEHSSYNDKRKRIYSSLSTIIDDQVKQYSLKLKSGEIRNRILWCFLRKDKYMCAYYINSFLCSLINILNRLKVANYLEALIKR